MLFRKCVSGVRFLVLATAMTSLVPLWQTGTTRAQVSIGISVNSPPPALPVYEQPPCPGEGYIWTPGYWAWDPDYGDYYWVPGTWVPAPRTGYLWTPPWWGWNGLAFVFHEGYWGPRVGFYGGIDYGYGYTSSGYYGGRWDHDRFYYNRSVNNVNVTQVRNVYNTTVVNNVNVTRVSYNGGSGGVQERATVQEQQAEREHHIRAVAAQQQHFQEARRDQALRASDNHGKPPIAATDKPAQFRGGTVVAAKAGNYSPPPNRAQGANRPVATPAPTTNRPAPNSAPNARPNANRPPENRSDRPPNASRPAPTPNANPPANRPAPNANPRPNLKANPDRPEANRPAPNPNPPRATPKTPNQPNPTNPNTNERRQQEEQRMKQQQNQQRARAEQQQRENQARKPQQEQQQQQKQQQQPKAQPKPEPKPQQRPQPKQQPPPKQEQHPDGQKPPSSRN